MANGENARAKGHIREYWSRRPFAGWGWGKMIKRLTHRQERHMKKELLREATNGDHLGEG